MERITCTGSTIEELGEELRTKGSKARPHCYLCRRKEGDKGIALVHSDGDDNIATPKVELFIVERKMCGCTFRYRLCWECAILLEKSHKMDLEKWLGNN